MLNKLSLEEWVNTEGQKMGEQNIKILKMFGWGRGNMDVPNLKPLGDRWTESTVWTSPRWCLLIISPECQNSLCSQSWQLTELPSSHNPRTSFWCNLKHITPFLQATRQPTFTRWCTICMSSDILGSLCQQCCWGWGWNIYMNGIWGPKNSP